MKVTWLKKGGNQKHDVKNVLEKKLKWKFVNILWWNVAIKLLDQHDLMGMFKLLYVPTFENRSICVGSNCMLMISCYAHKDALKVGYMSAL